jgi:hypothetical protein
MRDPKLKALTVYVDKAVYEAARLAAEADGRSVTNFLARLITASPFLAPLSTGELQRMTGARPATARAVRDAKQIDLEDAIVAAVKRGPSKPAKHK